MSLDMHGQMVRPDKGPCANAAAVWLLPRVPPLVSLQLVSAGKCPVAVLPGAAVGLVAAVDPGVGRQVARLGVRLAAGRDGTHVLVPAGCGCDVLWCLGCDVWWCLGCDVRWCLGCSTQYC